jgi:hypothetical protein
MFGSKHWTGLVETYGSFASDSVKVLEELTSENRELFIQSQLGRKALLSGLLCPIAFCSLWYGIAAVKDAALLARYEISPLFGAIVKPLRAAHTELLRNGRGPGDSLESLSQICCSLPRPKLLTHLSGVSMSLLLGYGLLSVWQMTAAKRPQGSLEAVRSLCLALLPAARGIGAVWLSEFVSAQASADRERTAADAALLQAQAQAQQPPSPPTLLDRLRALLASRRFHRLTSFALSLASAATFLIDAPAAVLAIHKSHAEGMAVLVSKAGSLLGSMSPAPLKDLQQGVSLLLEYPIKMRLLGTLLFVGTLLCARVDVETEQQAAAEAAASPLQGGGAAAAEAGAAAAGAAPAAPAKLDEGERLYSFLFRILDE